MRQVLEIVMADGKPHRLDVVIEHGHRNARDTIEIFNDVKRRLKERRGLDLLGEIVTAKKHERAPLMVADFLASTYFMMRASRAGGRSTMQSWPLTRQRDRPALPSWNCFLTHCIA
jgi:hypothetical protein